MGQEQNLTCTECLYSIKNPICSSCFLKQINVWLKDREIATIYRNIIISKLKNTVAIDSNNEENCIICNNESPSLCSYCFFHKVALSLQEINFGDKELEEFLEIFNYRHYHPDYHIYNQT